VFVSLCEQVVAESRLSKGALDDNGRLRLPRRVCSGRCGVARPRRPTSSAGSRSLADRCPPLNVTHAHPDHIGSLAAVRSATGAAVYCLPADLAIVTAGGGFRPLRLTPGVVTWLVWRLFIRPILRRFARVDPTPVDHAVYDGQVLPVSTPFDRTSGYNILTGGWHASAGLGHVRGMPMRVISFPESGQAGGPLAFSPDGTALASLSDDGITLWDPVTRNSRVTCKGHTDVIKSLAFSPDGKFIASASFDETVKLWDVGTGKDLATLTGHNSKVWSVAFSPDGMTIASTGYSKIKLWDTVSGKETATYSTAADGIFSVAFSPAGRTLASGEMNGNIRMWDVPAGTERAVLKHTDLWVWAVVYSPDGTTIASAGGDRTIKLWQAVTGNETARLAGYGPEEYSLCFSPSGQLLASGGGDEVRLWDVLAGNEVATLQEGGKVWPASFSPDGKTIASARDNKIKLWQVDSSESFRR
jgi:uncharacterized protein with WD repeat